MARRESAALTTIEVPVLTHWFVNITGGKGTKPSEALYGWADMRLKQLDGWLGFSDRYSGALWLNTGAMRSRSTAA